MVFRDEVLRDLVILLFILIVELFHLPQIPDIHLAGSHPTGSEVLLEVHGGADVLGYQVCGDVQIHAVVVK